MAKIKYLTILLVFLLSFFSLLIFVHKNTYAQGSYRCKWVPSFGVCGVDAGENFPAPCDTGYEYDTKLCNNATTQNTCESAGPFSCKKFGEGITCSKDNYQGKQTRCDTVPNPAGATHVPEYIGCEPGWYCVAYGSSSQCLELGQSCSPSGSNTFCNSNAICGPNKKVQIPQSSTFQCVYRNDSCLECEIGLDGKETNCKPENVKCAPVCKEQAETLDKKCEEDTWQGKQTYCTLSILNGRSQTVGYKGCGFGQYCAYDINPGPTNSNGSPLSPSGSCGEGNIDTAVGCIPISSGAGFIGFLLKWAVGIGGGVAFLMMLFAGFNIMTSSGDPQRLKGGQELLTSSVAGLIMLIFSVFILRLIGIDILQIPGFSS